MTASVQNLSERHSSEPIEERIHSWVVNGKTITLLRQDQSLSCSINDQNQNARIPLDCGHRGIDSAIQRAVRRLPVLKEDGSVSFLKAIDVIKRGNLKLSLLKKENQTIVNVHDIEKDENFQSKLKFFDKYFLGSRISRKLGFKYKSHICQVFLERCDHSDLYSMAKASLLQGTSLRFDEGKLSEFYAEGPNYQTYSKIDRFARMNCFRWVVTLARYRGHTECLGGKFCKDSHVQIVIEGLDDEDRYFMRISELMKTNDVRSKIFNPDTLRYKAKTKTWEKSKLDVEKMLCNIEGEIAECEQAEEEGNGRVGVPWSRIGEKSILAGLSGRQNCFDWARKKLKMLDINVGESYLEYIVSTPNYLLLTDRTEEAVQDVKQFFSEVFTPANTAMFFQILRMIR